MKMCKVLLAALLAVMMLVSLCACGDQPAAGNNGDTSTTTTTTTAPTDDGKATYSVTVLDDSGAPVSGAMVQICKETCIPTVTDDNGNATWRVAEDEYKVSFAIVPDGYEVEEAYYFEDGTNTMTITIKKAA